MDSTIFSLTVPEGTSDRIDNFLANSGDLKLSKGAIQKLFASGNITINGRVAKKGNKVSRGQVIQIIMPSENTVTTPLAQEIPLDIVFQDEHIIVINKEAGLAVHPSTKADAGNELTLVSALLHMFGPSGLSKGEEPNRPGIVHRLDKETSGLMVVCRTDETHAILKNDFQTHKNLTKTYHTIVHGHFANQEPQKITNYICHHPKVGYKMMVTDDPSKGKESITNYTVLKQWTYQNEKLSLVEVQIETGRTHQIRVTMSHLQHPVLGDPLYHKKNPKNQESLCLLAKKLEFEHPISKEKLTFEVPYPKNFIHFMPA